MKETYTINNSEHKSIEHQINEWIKEYSDYTFFFHIPKDRIVSDDTEANWESLSIEINSLVSGDAQTNELFEESKLITYLYVMFFKYTEQEEILVDMSFIDDTKEAYYNSVLPVGLSLSSSKTIGSCFSEIKKKISVIKILGERIKKIEDIIKFERTEGFRKSPIFFLFLKEDVEAQFVSEITERYKAVYDLIFISQIKNDSLEITSYFNVNYYNTERIEKLLDHYKSLLPLDNSIKNKRIDELILLTEKDRKLIPDPSEKIQESPLLDIINVFRNVSNEYKDNIAISKNGISWTYSDLLNSSENIAKSIISKIGSNQYVVAVVGESSFGFISSMIGVLMSGNILLTVDITLPEERQLSMIKTAQVSLLLSIDDKKISNIEFPVDTVSVNSDKGLDESLKDIDINIPSIDLENPAYIFFTSGSTGNPKGVKGSHKGLAHFLHWQSKEFDISPSDRHSQLTALSFDVLLRDVFLPLLNGAVLCIPENRADIASAKLLSWLDEEKITIIHTVPSLANSWIKNIPEGCKLESLRVIFFAGEPLSKTLLINWKNNFEATKNIVNLYGPTETTLAKTFYRITENTLIDGIQLIGHPLPNTQVLILDNNMGRCAPLELGEIFIRTPYRSLGYINNKDENQRLFLKNPFGTDIDDLIYRTGDLGRYRYDGVLEILGRRDNQIKIRGVRIEPGEIEAKLNDFNNISESLVMAYPEKNGEKELSAYFTLKDRSGQVPNIFSIRKYLESQLPINMIPRYFILLDTFPLNQNGKINRKMLPKIDSNICSGQEYIAPETKLEQDIVQIWKNVLNIKTISMNDNFFYLGGNSILAVKAVTGMNKLDDLNISLAVFFQKPIIAEIIKHMYDDLSNNDQSVVPLNGSSDLPTLFCVVGIGIYQQLARELSNDYYVCGVYQNYEHKLIEYIQSGKKNDWKYKNIESIAAGYILAIREKQESGPYFLAGVSYGGIVAFEIARQLQEIGEDVGGLILLDSHLPNGKKYTLKGKILYPLKRIKNRLIDFRMKPEKYSQRDIENKRDEINSMAKIKYDKDQKSYNKNVLLIKAKETDYGNGEYFTDDLGWSRHVNGKIKVIEINGTHLGILKKPYVDALALSIKDYLNKENK